MDLVKALQAIIDNPEDLSQLPQIIEAVTGLLNERDSLEENVGRLQEINRNTCLMIPIKDETEEVEEVEEELPTLDDAIKAILEGGINNECSYNAKRYKSHGH